MKLTDGQEQARSMVRALLQEGDSSYGILSGYAGTGKTTMLKVVAEEFGIPAIMTPTGKASLRVAEATSLPAMTIHRWLYRATENPKTGDLMFSKKPIDEIQLPENGLVVIDEASMVGEQLWMDVWGLCSALGLKVLLVGDRFQLPPVRREGGEWTSFSTLTNLKTPHRTDLTEVCRQALDSPIIRASMLIRQSDFDAIDAVSSLPQVHRGELVDRFLSMDESRALIAHKNETRRALNLEVRSRLGYKEGVLEAGEPLLVLFNNYQVDRFNGEVVDFDEWHIDPGTPQAVRDRWKNLAALLTFGLASDEGQTVMLSQEEVFGQTGGLPEHTISRSAKDYAVGQLGYNRKEAPSHLNANLGYCLTCHKAQGSEWRDVLVCIEGSVGLRTGGVYGFDGRRWLYTAITRARQNVVLSFV